MWPFRRCGGGHVWGDWKTDEYTIQREEYGVYGVYKQRRRHCQKENCDATDTYERCVGMPRSLSSALNKIETLER